MHEADNTDRQLPALRKPAHGKRLIALGAIGLLVIAAAVGGYFTFFAGGMSARHKVQPKRELPSDDFAFRPGDRADIVFINAELFRESGRTTDFFPYREAFLPAGEVFEWEDLKSVTMMSVLGDKNLPHVTVITYLAPTDVAAIAHQCGMTELPGRRGIFVQQTQRSGFIAFQAGPNRVVFAGTRESDISTPHEEMVKLADRKPNALPLPGDIKEGLEEVSGYARLTFQHSAEDGEESLYFYGRKVGPAGEVVEEFVIEAFESSAAASKHHKEEEAGGKPTDRETARWVRGKKSYVFSRKL